MPRSSVRSKVSSSWRSAASIRGRLARSSGYPDASELDDRADELRHESVGIAEQPAVADRAPDQEAQHVAAIGVRRIDAVGDQERHRARVIGDDVLARAVARRPRAPSCRSAAARRSMSVKRSVSYIDALPLHDREHAFEAGAGVDGLARQFARACRRRRDCTAERRRSKSRRTGCRDSVRCRPDRSRTARRYRRRSRCTGRTDRSRPSSRNYLRPIARCARDRARSRRSQMRLRLRRRSRGP